MRFVLRDDDACAFTTPQQILQCYAQIWQQVPVSLSVTPHRLPGPYRFIPEEQQAGTRRIALHENREFTSFLKQMIAERRVQVAMHGYDHGYRDGVPEYALDRDHHATTRSGRLYLKELLGSPVKAFVPPSNRIGRRGFRAVIAAGMHLVNIPSLHSTSVRGVSAAAYLQAPRVYWHTRVRHQAYPHVLDFGDHKEVGYHTAGPQSRTGRLLEAFEYCHACDGVFVLATHYHAFGLTTASGDSVRSAVMSVLDRAAGKADVTFAGLDDIW